VFAETFAEIANDEAMQRKAFEAELDEPEPEKAG